MTTVFDADSKMSAFTYQNVHHDDASSSNFDSDPFEPFESHLDQPFPHPRAFLPLPDLRFEQSYLKSIKNFVHIEELDKLKLVDEKGKGKQAELDSPTSAEPAIRRDVRPIVDSSHHLIAIDWGKVIWITTRDQIISPLIQGALWGVGSHFLRPFISSIGSRIRNKSVTLSQNREPGWWKWWIHGLGLGSGGVGRAKTDISGR